MLTIFTTAKPFQGHIGIIQRNAIQSWKLLHPEVEIILFGDDEGSAEICREFGLRHEPNIIRNPSGTKRLDQIFGRAQEMARYDILAYVNCDIILTRDFLNAAQRVRMAKTKFLMVGRRWDTDVTEPLDFSRPTWEQEIVGRAQAEGIQRFYHNVDYFVFRRGLYTQIPPLVIGRVWWDHWLVGKAHALGAAVVDVSGVTCAVHQNHDYNYHAQGLEGVWRDEEAQRNYEITWRETRPRTIEDAPFRLTATGIERNKFYWLAPAKRRWRDVVRGVRAAFRTCLWHPLLNATRPIRHAIGLKRDGLRPALRGGERRHWLDQ